MGTMKDRNVKEGHLTPLEISACLDSPETLAASRTAHLRSCPECAHMVAQLRFLQGSIRSLPRQAPAVDFASRVQRELRRSGRRAAWRAEAFPRRVAPFALAATVVIAIGVWLGGMIAQPSPASPDGQRFSYLAVFAPSPFGYPCEDRAICNDTRNGL